MTGDSLDPYTALYAQRTHGLTVSEIRALFAVASRPEVVSLAGGSPNVAALPLDAIADTVRDLIATEGASALQYCGGQGDVRLREHICDVMAEEGVLGSAEDVVVTVGSQQALDLVARVFIDPGDIILAEGPSYVGALGVFAAAEADVVHVPLDADGLSPDALEEAITSLAAQGRKPKFLYTVPNFHNPAGVTMSAARRPAIVAVAERHNILIVEDNPYGLLGFDQEPQPALRTYSDTHVIYLGSFSKTFAAGLRVGWVFAPPAVREKLVLLSEAEVLCPPMLTQKTVVRYLEQIAWRDQIKVFREVYRERRDAMLDALGAMMPAGTTWTHPAGGFFVWVTLPEGIDSKVMQPRAIHARVAYVPGVGFYADGQGRREMRLCYSLPPPDRIHEGVRRLAGVIEDELELRATFLSGGQRAPAHSGRIVDPGPGIG
ncbi:MAG: PLP-dependent aminotransferase family protein [Mycobacteriales bacterium]